MSLLEVLIAAKNWNGICEVKQIMFIMDPKVKQMGKSASVDTDYQVMTQDMKCMMQILRK